MTDRLRNLLSPLFIFFLVLLVVNDFFLKAAFPNILTGKLSDVSGLFIFPIFWSAIFPKQKLWIFLFTAILFSWWKSEYSSGMIQLLHPYFGIRRTVDISDLMALPMIGLAWFYIKRDAHKPILTASMSRLSAYCIGAIAIFSFCATSQQRYIQSFEQPQYVLLQDPVLHDLTAYSEFECYKRGALLVVKVNYLNINRPAKDDDYNKNLIIKNLDRDVLLTLADSARLIPQGNITELTISSAQGIDSLRFNGGRLDGRFVRMKNGKPVIEGFYKMGLEDSTWIISDTIGTNMVMQTFVNGETTNIKHYNHDRLQSSSTVNTRADTIHYTYVRLVILILCMGGIGFWLYKNYRKAAPGYLKLKLMWRLLIVVVAPIFVWLCYFGIRLLFRDNDQDIFQTVSTIIFIFITICPLMVVIVFLVKLRKEVDILLYCLLFALACCTLTTYTTLEALAN